MLRKKNENLESDFSHVESFKLVLKFQNESTLLKRFLKDGQKLNGKHSKGHLWYLKYYAMTFCWDNLQWSTSEIAVLYLLNIVMNHIKLERNSRKVREQDIETEMVCLGLSWSVWPTKCWAVDCSECDIWYPWTLCFPKLDQVHLACRTQEWNP